MFEQALAIYERSGVFDAPRRIRVIVFIEVERALPLISAGYDWATREEEVLAQWEQYYKTIRPVRAEAD